MNSKQVKVNRRDVMQMIPFYVPAMMRTSEVCHCDNPETNGKASWLVFICKNCEGLLDRMPIEIDPKAIVQQHRGP